MPVAKIEADQTIPSEANKSKISEPFLSCNKGLRSKNEGWNSMQKLDMQRQHSMQKSWRTIDRAKDSRGQGGHSKDSI